MCRLAVTYFNLAVLKAGTSHLIRDNHSPWFYIYIYKGEAPFTLERLKIGGFSLVTRLFLKLVHTNSLFAGAFNVRA